jgi:MGT family glycosyltransferase
VSRILISVPPLTGHVNPTVAVGAALVEQGHDVAWTGLPGVVDRLLPPVATFLPLIGDLDQRGLDELQARARGLRGPAALKFLWEGFILPYARATARDLLAVVEELAPDVLLVDQQAIAGAVAARVLDVPWATSATTSAELTDPLAALPRVDGWVRAQMLDLQIELGVDPALAQTGDLRFSDELVIAFTTPELTGPAAAARRDVCFVGPSIEARPDATAFPWDWLVPGRRRVLVSLGTVNADIGARFFTVAVEALRDTGLQVIVVAPPDLLDGVDRSDHVLVQERVPQLDLLPHVDVVVSHGGHNTVCETLAHGRPLVLAPIRDDQPIVAQQVVDAGAGVRVPFARVDAVALRHAVLDVLDDPTYRAGAEVIQASFRRAGGARAAADAIGRLVRQRQTA